MASRDELFARRRRPSEFRTELPVLAVIMLGGVIGACARYGAERLWPPSELEFPWTTLAINVSGCALMGMLIVAINEVWAGHYLLRPLLGIGVLGGYTTFSEFVGDVDTFASTGHWMRAALYVTTTPLVAMVATWLAATLTHLVIIRRIPWRN